MAASLRSASVRSADSLRQPDGTRMTDDMIASEVECLWEARATLGEGLVFDAHEQRLWFVDIKRPRLFGFGLADGERRVMPLPAQVSAIALPGPAWKAPAANGPAFLSAGALGFAWLVLDGGEPSLLPISHPESHLAGNRFNDGKLAPDGRFYAGTMDDAEQRATGSLYALAPDGAVTRVDQGYRVTNGPAFAPDGRTIYHNDSALRRTYAFDVLTDGRWGPRRVLHAHREDGGYPDGMTVAASGQLYVAMWDGSRIQRLEPDGTPSGFVPVPVRRPTTCVFTSDRTLAFTSASIGLDSPGSQDGGLFHVRFT